MVNGKAKNEDGSGQLTPNPAARPCPPTLPQLERVGPDGFYGSGWGELESLNARGQGNRSGLV
jgi:hypothetical protein